MLKIICKLALWRHKSGTDNHITSSVILPISTHEKKFLRRDCFGLQQHSGANIVAVRVSVATVSGTANSTYDL